MDEELLTGGNSGVVSRAGDTVRRPCGAWTETIHALLDTLRDAGVTEVPKPLGRDDQGREVLSFLPGAVANYPLPDWLWSEQILADSGRLLRRLHDASLRFSWPEARWQAPTHEPVEVICHNDVAPYNMVFDQTTVVGLIDFDMASPGPRIWDLAYLAYRLVPFAEDAGSAAPGGDRRPRLDRLTAAYGMPFSPAAMALTIRARLTELAAFADQRAVETGNVELHAHAAMYRRDADCIVATVVSS